MGRVISINILKFTWIYNPEIKNIFTVLNVCYRCSGHSLELTRSFLSFPKVAQIKY